MGRFGGLSLVVVAAGTLVTLASCGSDNTTGAGTPGDGGGKDGPIGDDSSTGSDGGLTDSTNPGNDSGGADAPQDTADSAPVSFPAGTICNNSGTPRTHPATFKHLIFILFENKDYSQVMGSTNAPYINSIKDQCGYSTNYLDSCFVNDLISLPHYLALTSGSNCNVGLEASDVSCITDDYDPSSHTLSTRSIIKQATSYKAYNESMPNPCDPNSNGLYGTKHNPPPYYDNLSASCTANDVSIAEVTCTTTRNTPCTPAPSNAFTQDLANDNLAQFVWVTPNLINDMHGITVVDHPTNDVIQGDNWLHTYLPLILASPAYLRGDVAIYVLWDEQDTFTSGPTPNIFISPYTPPTVSNTTMNHFSALHTAEEQLGITTFLGCASGSPPGGGTCPAESTTSLRAIFNF
jgi:hypothetical protein